MSAMRVAVALAVLASAAAQGVAAGAEDAVDGVPCEPRLADCWADVAEHADCLLNPRNPRTHECLRANRTELCRAFEDALRCASDLPDNGCALRAGRRAFDFWIRGLEAVNTKLCFEGLMQSVVAHAECWDALNWARCVQHAVPGLAHVVDLVDALAPRQQHGQHGQQGDAGHHCHAAMLRMSKCASSTAALDPPPEPCLQALPPVDLINEVLAAYFSASECGGNLAACPPPHHHQQQEEALAATATTPSPTEPPPTAAAAPSAAEDGDRSDGRSNHLPAAASAGASAASPAHLRAAPAHAGALALAVLAVIVSIKLV